MLFLELISGIYSTRHTAGWEL